MFLEFINNLKLFGLEMLGLLYGTYFGKVKENKDKTFSGRIRVFLDSLSMQFKNLDDKAKRFYSQLGFAVDEQRSAMTANYISPYAGSNYGFYFPPEKPEGAKEVNAAVVFPMGKGGTPMYVGSWWCEGDIPVEFRNSDGTVTKRGIKTKGGHIILFEDSEEGDNSRRIEIKSISGHKVLLQDKEKKVDIVSKEGLVIEIDDVNSKIVLSAKGTSITLDGKSGKIYLHKADASQNYVRGLELFNDLAGHRHVGVHGMTSPPINSPRASILSQDIFGV